MRATHLRQAVSVVIYLAAAAWLVSLIAGLAGKANVAVNEAHDAERRYQELEERRIKIQANLTALETPLGQDAAIRKAFGVAREGEEVIVVVPAATATATPERTWWERVGDWF